LCWEPFLQLIIDIGCCLWIMPLHHVNSVLKQSSSNMNIFTNARVNTMHHDWSLSKFEFHILLAQFLNQHPIYGSQFMISHSKGYDTYKDIIDVRNLKIHVPCIYVTLAQFNNNYTHIHTQKITPMLAKLNVLILCFQYWHHTWKVQHYL
jgi:hypothetical protein